MSDTEIVNLAELPSAGWDFSARAFRGRPPEWLFEDFADAREEAEWTRPSEEVM